jgi:hypothetical protein
MPKQGGGSKVRYQIAALCFAAAVVMLFLAYRFDTRDFLISTPLNQRPGPGYSRVWFDNRDVLAGAIQQGEKLKLERWSGGPSSVETWDVDLGGAAGPAGRPAGTASQPAGLAVPPAGTAAPPSGTGGPEAPKWAVAGDFSRIAWISGSTLYWQPLIIGRIGRSIGVKTASRAIPLPAKNAPLALSILSDESVAVVFADSLLKRWDSSTGTPLGEWRTALVQPDAAAADQNYLAISSDHERRLLLYRFRDAEGWKLEEESSPPEPPYSLILPGPGSMATLSAEGFQIGHKTRNSPGAVRSAAKHLDEVITTGDFNQVAVLPPDEDHYFLAAAAPGSVVSANATQLAVSGPQGTALLRLASETRLTATGKVLSRWAVALLVATLLLSCWILLTDGFRSLLGLLFKQRFRQTQAPTRLPPPPHGLIVACASGESALFAGAGLSAQSGLPLRATFIANILQAASVEEMIPAAACKKLLGIYSRGDAEGALNGLVEAGRRGAIIEHFRAIFARLAIPSRCHEMLARVPFAAALTTNYDFLFQQADAHWAATATSLKSDLAPSFGERSSLIKLYGDLDHSSTLLLSRAEFQSAAADSGETARVRRILETRPMLFVGCSLEALLTDLKILGVAESRAIQHFALAGVSESSWEKYALDLDRHYGIRVLPCTEATVQTELVEFLEKLVCETDKYRHESAMMARTG